MFAYREIVSISKIFASWGRLDFYKLRDKESIGRFLTRNPKLVPLLVEATTQLKKHFGSEPTFILEVVKDYDAPYLDKIFVYIQTNISVEEALAQLDEFDEDWYLDQIDLVGELLNFDFKFLVY